MINRLRPMNQHSPMGFNLSMLSLARKEKLEVWPECTESEDPEEATLSAAGLLTVLWVAVRLHSEGTYNVLASGL